MSFLAKRGTAAHYSFGGVAIILSGLLIASGTLGTSYLTNQTNSTCTEECLFFAHNHGAFMDLSGTLTTLGIIFLIPATLILVFFLKDNDTVYVLTGGVFALGGAIVFLANAGSYFFFVDRASAFAQGSNTIALFEAQGSKSFVYGFQTAYLLIFAALVIFSRIMRTPTFKTGSLLGLAAGALGIFGSIGFIASRSFFDLSSGLYVRSIVIIGPAEWASISYDIATKTLVSDIVLYAGVVAWILFVVWTVMVGQKLRRQAEP